MFGFRRRKLEDALKETKAIYVHGVLFRIKKLDPFAYMDGSNAIAQVFQTWEQKRELTEPNMKKVKDHFRDVFLAGVVEPKLARKKEDEGVFVDNLFTDWGLANELYGAIFEYTYGKKKT